MEFTSEIKKATKVCGLKEQRRYINQKVGEAIARSPDAQKAISEAKDAAKEAREAIALLRQATAIVAATGIRKFSWSEQ